MSNEDIKKFLDDLASISEGLWDDDGIDNITIDGIELKRTCFACPEQYDAFHNDKMVGYLRLRHGDFTVNYPDVGGKLILEESPQGDGMFEKEERMEYLTKAVKVIKKEMGL